ncbi:hypothetical protein SAMN05216203_2412 [Marinobacter daqiaonensis]|uniref:Uncharacterized protein n=1 Tax=Marinobacter daqiaonensis TaxID=650891 RepID=A0A1I6IK89_9GAMM|nr:hypothetical protein [Marinobacter daqiaonensis]SFR67145.1 hypothetical protein SAMN05216203_2412 [Marinobacter daqiaonensis]
MVDKSAAVLIGNHTELPREIWTGFVHSGLVDQVAVFSSVTDLLESLESPGSSRSFDIRLVFFLVNGPEDLSVPVDIKLHAELSRAPLTAFYSPDSHITETDIHNLYARRVNSVIQLPIRFQDLSRLVLQMDRYWTVGQLPSCELPLPVEKLYHP